LQDKLTKQISAKREHLVTLQRMCADCRQFRSLHRAVAKLLRTIKGLLLEAPLLAGICPMPLQHTVESTEGMLQGQQRFFDGPLAQVSYGVDGFDKNRPKNKPF